VSERVFKLASAILASSPRVSVERAIKVAMLIIELLDSVEGNEDEAEAD
jgi:hypothetical protein